MDVKIIDGHRHIVVMEAVAAGSKLNRDKSVHIYPSGLNERSEQVNKSKAGPWDRKMGDLEENLADLKAAGMEIGVLQPTQTMFFYWAGTWPRSWGCNSSGTSYGTAGVRDFS